MSELNDMMNEAAQELSGVEAPEEQAPVEETTEVESAPTEQTADDDSPAPVSEQTDEPASDRAVPYDRFKSVNDSKKAAEAEAARLRAEIDALRAQSPKPQPTGMDAMPPEDAQALRAALKAVGVDPDEVQSLKQKLSTYEQQQKVAKEEEAIASVESRYNGENGFPKFDREVLQSAVQEVLGEGKNFWEAVYLYVNRNDIVNAAAAKAAKRPVTATKAKPADRKLSSKLSQAMERKDPSELIDLALFGED